MNPLPIDPDGAPSLVTARRTDSLRTVQHLMKEHQITGVPVVEIPRRSTNGGLRLLEIVDARQSRIDTDTATLVCGSDAHAPGEVGYRWVEFDAARPTFDALRVALHDATVRCHGGTFSA